MCSGMYQVHIGVPGGYRNPRGKIWVIWAIGGRQTGPQGVPPKGGVRIGQGVGAAAPLSLSYSLSLSPFATPKKRKKVGGILLGLES